VTKCIKEITGEDVTEKLVILNDNDFVWFAKYALPIMARNVLEKETKKSENLWYEESLAPDTVMYMIIGEREAGNVETLTKAIAKMPYIQMGGNETIGQGWFQMKHIKGEGK
jgi:CRISPR-associated protein Cmr4